jgi:hypothetical protein
MLAKLTVKNQITLPKAAISQVEASEYFEVTVEAGRIVLTPMRLQQADKVREKLADMGITEADVQEAVNWARR